MIWWRSLRVLNPFCQLSRRIWNRRLPEILAWERRPFRKLHMNPSGVSESDLRMLTLVGIFLSYLYKDLNFAAFGLLDLWIDVRENV